MSFSKPSGDGLRIYGAAKKRVETGPRAYNSYFEGYTEFYTIDTNGKKKKQYVYTDPYYMQELTKKQRRNIKVVYSLAFLLIAALFVYASLQPYISMVLWYAQGVTLFLVAWLLYILVAFYIPAKAHLTAFLYKKSSKPLIWASLCVAIAFAVLAVALLVHLISNSDVSVKGGVLAILAYLFAGGIALMINRMERKIPYVQTKNDRVVPKDGYKIINDHVRPSERSDAVAPEKLK